MTSPSTYLVPDGSPRWRWAVAVVAFDHGDPEPLADLTGEAPPPELVPAVRERLAGRRKPNRRAVAGIRVAARDRLAVGQDVAVTLELLGIARTASDNESPWFMHLEQRQVRGWLARERRRLIREAAAAAGVSPRTAETLAAEYLRAVANYPNL